MHSLRLVIAPVPGLLIDRERRVLLAEIRVFIHQLPGQLAGPLPEAMAKLTMDVGKSRPGDNDEAAIGNLVNLVVAFDRDPLLGYNLRHSLTRYYFLRRAGLLLNIHFGARMSGGEPDRDFIGHAWLTLDGQPYYEAGENWRGFTVMLTFPSASDYGSLL